MGLTVTLNIFSGRSNPSWTLSEEQAEEITNRVQKMDELTGSKPPGVLGGLGYRGFILSGHPSEPAGALSLYVHEGIVDRGQTEINVIDRDRRIEMLLLVKCWRAARRGRSGACPGIAQGSGRRHIFGGPAGRHVSCLPSGGCAVVRSKSMERAECSAL